MSRTFFAALLALASLTSAAPAQTFYSGPTGYTSYYGPTYFHAPGYSSGYSSSSYTTGYRGAGGGFGPLGVLNPMTWFGWRPNRSVAYTSPYYGSTSSAGYAPSYGYTAGYSPSYGYTTNYSPLLLDTTTSYYAPAGDSIALAAYEAPLAPTGSACCPTSCCPNSCCQPCGGCSSCATGNCPGGNCALNYAPSADMTPKADPTISGSSGSRTYQSESKGNNGASGNTNGDNFGPYNRNRPDDGYNPDGSRRSGYRPAEQIQQKAPTNDPDGTDNGAAADKKTDAPAAAPDGDEKDPAAAAPALNLDAKIAAGPSLLRERLRMTARFGSPQLARAKADPATLPAAELRLVQK